MDDRAFAAQYQLAYTRLRLIAVGIIGDRAHAEDIVQEAAIIGLRKLDEFTPGSNLVAWLSEIVRRCALNYVRKTSNRGTVAADPRLLDLATGGAQPTGSMSSAVTSNGTLCEHQTEFDDHVLRALNSLSDVARCCLLLRTVQNLSYAEISQLMNIPEGTAMSHVHRSRTAMRRQLQQRTLS
jgi:RNA polymerase sigma-70 factor (ECF subfamily)